MYTCTVATIIYCTHTCTKPINYCTVAQGKDPTSISYNYIEWYPIPQMEPCTTIHVLQQMHVTLSCTVLFSSQAKKCGWRYVRMYQLILA